MIEQVSDYYTKKLLEHGPTHRGVDWNSQESQELRFHQLIKIIDTSAPFSILDYGCGYGSLFPFLREKAPGCKYTGYDVSPDMVAAARQIHGECDNCIWIDQRSSLQPVDFVVASGLFNVKLDNPSQQWHDYTLDVLSSLDAYSTKAFAFNMLTSYSDKEFMREDLFYAEPMYVFDYCKRRFSPYVALLHDYPLYEFTILVRKKAGF